MYYSSTRTTFQTAIGLPTKAEILPSSFSPFPILTQFSSPTRPSPTDGAGATATSGHSSSCTDDHDSSAHAVTGVDDPSAGAG